MITKHIKAFSLAAVFSGIVLLTGCNTGTEPGETNVERGEVIEEGSLDEGYTSDDYPVDADTVNSESYYDDAEGAVHAGDGKTDGVDRGDVDENNKE